MDLDRRRLTVMARLYLVAAVVMSVLFLLSGRAERASIAAAMMLSVVPAGFVARRIHGFPRLFSVGLAIVASSYVLEAVAADAITGSSAQDIADSIDLLATLVIIGLAAYLVRRRSGGLTLGDLLDGLIIGSGAWLVSWILLVQPLIAPADRTVVSVVLNGMYLPTAMPLIVLAAVILFGGGRPRPATVAISVGLMCNVIGDILYALDDARDLGAWSYTAADVLYIFSVATCAAGLVHPTAPSLVGHRPHSRRVTLPGRLSAVVVSQIIPLGMLTLITAATPVDRIVRTVSAFVIMGLVGVRLYTATRAQLRAQENLARAARTDELTDLPNKRSLLETAADSIDDLWESGHRPSLYLFDLDRFKNINDSLGHDVGDDLLVHIACRLDAAATSIGATASRPSGDEFLVFDPTPTDEIQAMQHARALFSIFRDAFETCGGDLIVTASCGVSTMAAGQPTDAAELFRWADIALYRSKATGRDRIVAFDASMSVRVTERLEIEHALRGAIDRREMHLFHQPIINVADGSVSGLEALIRWRRPDGTMIQPDDFIGVAEETGQIDEIGAWAMLEALTQLRGWIDDGVVSSNTTMSVNVSPRQLADHHFASVVREALRRSGMPARLLWLEVTESVMADNAELARVVLEQIQATGVRIALDDFGTGYSSLSLLQRFPIQRIKIDQAFVSGLAESENDRTLVRTVVGLGASMGVDIVAEGVENVVQLKMLRQFGCAKAQGFLISRPIPPEAMRSTIAALDGLSDWPEFANVLGESSLDPSPRNGN